MLSQREDSIIEEASNPGGKVDSCPKESTSNSPGFAQEFYKEKRKGLCAGWGRTSIFRDDHFNHVVPSSFQLLLIVGTLSDP